MLERGIAVVGTRQPTPYGVGMAEVLSRDLANRRMTILSGMARGVDTAAHKAALRGEEGRYRRGARGSMSSIRRRTSDVFAVPGNVTTKNAWGPNTLIKQGAKLTVTWEDVWEDLASIRLALEDEMEALDAGVGAGARGESGGLASKAAGIASLFNETGEGEAVLPQHEQVVTGRLRHDEAMQLDALIEGLEGELASPEIFTALFELELAGRVKQLPGKNYVRCF